MSRKTQTLIIFFLITVIWDMYKRQREKAEYTVLLNSIRRIPTTQTTTTSGSGGEVDSAAIAALQQQIQTLTNQFNDFETLNNLPIG